jgi:uncharacterized protein (DUF488 family)
MLTSEFREGVDELLEIAAAGPTAILCSESVFWRCHRKLVSDFLVAQGVDVQHIFPDGRTQPHRLSPEAVVADGQVTYPGEPTLFD